MLFHTFLLSAFFDFGQKLGPVLSWVFILLMVAVFGFAMVKYVFSAPPANNTRDNAGHNNPNTTPDSRNRAV